MTNVWLHPAYDTGPQLVLSNSNQTMTRVSGANLAENLPFDSDLTLANGAAPVIVSAIFSGIVAADDMIFGIRNATQTVTVGNYPGETTNTIGVMSDGHQIYNNNTATTVVSGGFANGDQADMEIDRTASPATVRFRKNGGSWSGTTDISGLGAGTWTIWATTWQPGNVVTYVNAGGGGATSDPSAMMMRGIG